METISCTLTDISGNSSQGQAQLATLSTGERVRRGLKRGAIIFGASFIFLPVPGLHWIPILGLLVSIFYGLKTAKEPTLIREISGDCPACRKHVIFPGPINATESKEICPECRTLLKMRPAALHLV